MIYVVGMAMLSLWTTWMTIKHHAPQGAAYLMLIVTICVAAASFQPRINGNRGTRK